MDVVTSLRQLTEISEYISQEISTGGDPYLSTFGHLEGVKNRPPLLECPNI